MDYPGPPLQEIIRDAQIVGRSTLGALAILVWDILITLDVEVACIWSKPSSSFIKWLFLFTRYFALFAEIINALLSPALSNMPKTPQFCKASSLSQIFLAQIMIVSVDLILMMRVRALWNQNRWVTAIMALFLVIESVIGFSGFFLNFSDEYGEGCVLIKAHYIFFYFWIVGSALMTQVVILLLTLVRCVRFGSRSSPAVFLMARDGAIAFFTLLFVGSVSLLLFALTTGQLSLLGYSWFLSVSSSAGCRLILSMLRLAQPRDTASFAPELTTEVCDITVPSTATTESYYQSSHSSKSPISSNI